MYLTQKEIIKNFISNFINYAEYKLSEKELNLFMSFQSQISDSLIAEIANSYDEFGAEHKFEIKRIDLDLNLSKTYRNYDEQKKQKVRSSLLNSKDFQILQRLIQRPCNTKLLLGKFAHESLGFSKHTLIPKLLNYKIETDCYSPLQDIYADYPQNLIIELLKEHLPSENIIKDYETPFSKKYKEINLNLKEYKDRNIDVGEFVNKMEQLQYEVLALVRENKLSKREYQYLTKTIESNRR